VSLRDELDDLIFSWPPTGEGGLLDEFPALADSLPPEKWEVSHIPRLNEVIGGLHQAILQLADKVEALKESR